MGDVIQFPQRVEGETDYEFIARMFRKAWPAAAKIDGGSPKRRLEVVFAMLLDCHVIEKGYDD